MASFGAIYIILIILEPGDKLLQIVTMLQAIAVILNTYEVLLYWFQMRLEMRMVTIASMLALTVTAIWRVSLLANSATIEFFALSNSITSLVTAGCIVLFFEVSRSKPKLSIDISLGMRLLSSSYHL